MHSTALLVAFLSAGGAYAQLAPYTGGALFCGGCKATQYTIETGAGCYNTVPGTCVRADVQVEECKLMCKPGKRTKFAAKRNNTWILSPEGLICNNNKTISAADGIAGIFSFASCFTEPPCDQCEPIPAATYCPPNYNCRADLITFNNDNGCNQLTCKNGYLVMFEPSKPTTPLWSQTPFCSTAGFWGNSSRYYFESGFRHYENGTTATCAQPVDAVNCITPSVTVNIPSNIAELYDIDDTKIVITNDILETKRCGCKPGFSLLAFSVLNATNVGLDFSTGPGHMQCNNVAKWINGNGALLPTDTKVTCGKKKAKCTCGFQPVACDECNDEAIGAIASNDDDDCLLACPPGFRLAGRKPNGKLKWMKKLHCKNHKWKGLRAFFENEEEDLDEQPLLSCVPDRLKGCKKEPKPFKHHECSMEKLRWKNNRFMCDKGSVLVISAHENITDIDTEVHAASITVVNGVFVSFDMMTGALAFWSEPYISCYEKPKKKPEFEPCEDLPEECGDCGFHHRHHHKTKGVCSGGVLTVSFEIGHICPSDPEMTLVANLTTVMCQGGNWFHHHGGPKTHFHLKGAFERCEGPNEEDSTTPMPHSTHEPHSTPANGCKPGPRHEHCGCDVERDEDDVEEEDEMEESCEDEDRVFKCRHGPIHVHHHDHFHAFPMLRWIPGLRGWLAFGCDGLEAPLALNMTNVRIRCKPPHHHHSSTVSPPTD